MIDKIITLIRQIFSFAIDLISQTIPNIHARIIEKATEGKVQFDQKVLLSPQLATSLLGYKDEETSVYYLSTFSFFSIVAVCLFVELMFCAIILAVLASFI